MLDNWLFTQQFFNFSFSLTACNFTKVFISSNKSKNFLKAVVISLVFHKIHSPIILSLLFY